MTLTIGNTKESAVQGTLDESWVRTDSGYRILIAELANMESDGRTKAALK